jgi:RimJ/RimL family protein N-acetyltransferase
MSMVACFRRLTGCGRSADPVGDLRRTNDMPVTLRLHDDGDAAELAAAVRESSVEMAPWMPWCHARYSESDAAGFIRAAREDAQKGSAHAFVIVEETGRFAGGCGINQINPSTGVANLGYWVRSTAAGRGIAPAAVLLLVKWAFEHTPLHRLEIVVAVGNLRSQRVAEKIGAHRDAVLGKRTLVHGSPSDAILYSVLRPD